jgi:hypothetical protein
LAQAEAELRQQRRREEDHQQATEPSSPWRRVRRWLEKAVRCTSADVVTYTFEEVR